MVKVELTKLFSPGKIGDVKIKNRIVRSATFEGLASREGYVTDDLIAFYTNLAQGGTGLIITGATAVDSRYSVGSRCQCLNDDSFMSGQQKLVKAVHEHPDVKIGVQLAHNGRLGVHPKYKPVAPSPVKYKATGKVPREMTTGEVEALIKKFVVAGRRAFECGYDLVQLHGCHGYLLSSFLSPYTNKRIDDFGGTTEKRTRILIDIYNQLRDEVGKNYPIFVKVQVIDAIPGGLTIEEAKKIVEILVNVGYDAIEPSGGSSELELESNNHLPSNKVKNPEDENYLLPAAKELKPLMNDIPLILVGGIRNPLSAEKFLQEDTCNFISLSRPLISEPDLPNRWSAGDLTPASCVSCNSCLYGIFVGRPLACAVKAKLERKKQRKQGGA